MIRTSVNSSAIRSVGHEGTTLEVEMSSGQVYQYHEVPRALFTELLAAPSAGKYFAQHIRQGGFKHSKVAA